MTTFKVFYEDECRRFKFHGGADPNLEPTVQWLREKLAVLPAASALKLAWKDEDGDMITIVDNNDLAEAIRAHEGSPVRITASVSASTTKAGPTPTPMPMPTPAPAPGSPTPAHEPAAGPADDSDEPVADEQSPAAGPTAEPAEPTEREKLDALCQTVSEMLNSTGVVQQLFPGKAIEAVVEQAAPMLHAMQQQHHHRHGRNRGRNHGHHPRSEEHKPVHAGVMCDVTNECPIVGARFHKVGDDYDLCAAAFKQLPAELHDQYEVIWEPGSEPMSPNAFHKFRKEVKEAQKQAKRAEKEAQKQARRADKAANKGGKKGSKKGFKKNAGGKCGHGGRKHGGGHCGGFGRPGHWAAGVVSEPGVVLPEAPLGFGRFGPGVAQLQQFLIGHGLLSQDAIRCRAGFFGPQTAQAVHLYQESAGLASEPGLFDDATRDSLLFSFTAEPDAADAADAPVPPPVTAADVFPSDPSEDAPREPVPVAEPEPEEEPKPVQPEPSAVGTVIKVGPSQHNIKLVQLPEQNLEVTAEPVNPQDDAWADTFTVRVDGSTLIVRRTDCDGGWGQDLELIATEVDAEQHAAVDPQQPILEEVAAEEITAKETAPVASSEPAVESAEEADPRWTKWASELAVLDSMGFPQSDTMVELLETAQGSLNIVIAQLLQ